VSSLHNVGASVLISPIYIEEGVYRYQQTAVGRRLKEGKTIHLGNTDSGYQRESKYSTDGSYRIIDGKY
jgi:outer membrane protease